MAIRIFNQWKPLVARSVFIAPNAEVIGRVTLEKGSSVWYGCVLRGDLEPIHVGALSNIQDLSLIHTDRGVPTIIGKGVTIGHQVCLHGAKVGDYSLIGMGAVILSGVEIGKGSIIGAGALAPEGRIIPPGVLALGVPCKIIRDLTREERNALKEHAKRYGEYARQHINMIKMGDDLI
jgi:carbonic anhydrase/acetyltransferase-like protein (isoleucine patch superfamily)